ncbi:hypothetical protein AC249_AIPGENE22393 [Exaiptasia diaphana]|nr:hypothetical protein AC249_AIPGENE22393 [Exaiptasia diaphana]
MEFSDEEDAGLTGEEVFQKYFGGKRKKSASDTSRKQSGNRNTITDIEITLYRKAIVMCGNDWKKILQFICSHKDILEKNVADKYDLALKNINDKNLTKSIRNRLGNVGRKARNSTEVSRREERHVLDQGSSTAEDVIKAMGEGKTAEKNDPLNLNVYNSMDDEASVDDGQTSDTNVLQTQASPEITPGPSSPGLPPPPKKPKKTQKAGKDPMSKLHARAESLLDVRMATAKMHMKFLRKSAASQGFSISDSDTD